MAGELVRVALFYAAFLVLLSFLASTPGCAPGRQPDAAQSLTVTETTYQVALDAISNAIGSGVLTVEQVRPYVPYIKALNAALDAAEADRAAGNTSAAKAALDAVSAAYRQLQPLLAKAHGPSTRPFDSAQGRPH